MTALPDTSWARRAPAVAVREAILTGVLGPLMALHTRRRVVGREALADVRGPVIFVATHASHMDTPLVLRALPRAWRRRTAVAAAADYFFGDRLTAGAVSLAFNTVPVHRRGPDVGAASELDAVLAQGWSLVVFAEGTRSRDGTVGPLRSGAAVLAARHGVALVPVRVSGTHAVMPVGRRWMRLERTGLALRPPARRGALRPGGAPARGRAPQGGHGARPGRSRGPGRRDDPRRAPGAGRGRPAVTRVFVTGGSGFIGGVLTQRLVARGDRVVALARSDAAATAVSRHGAEAVRGDVLDEDSLVAGMAGCGLAFHVAGVNTHCPPDPSALMRVNVEGAVNAVRAAARAGVPRVVLTSSAAAVGEAFGTVGHEDSPHRGSYLSLYDRSKHEGERAAFAAADRHDVEVVALNPSSVQGPGRTAGNGKIIIDYLNGRLRVFVDTWISVVDVADCVEGHLLAAERGRPGRRYVLNGATIPSGDALELVTALAGVDERVRMIPPPLARTAAAIVEAAARARGRHASLCRARVRTILHGHRYDGARATRELGLDYTPTAETFRRTIEWAVAEGLVTRPLPGVAGR